MLIFLSSLSGLVVLIILLGTGAYFELSIGVSRRAQGEVVISSFWKSEINCVRSDLAYHGQDDFPTSLKRFLALLNADTNMLTNMRMHFHCSLLRSMHVNSYHKFIDTFIPESVNFQRIFYGWILPGQALREHTLEVRNLLKLKRRHEVARPGNVARFRAERTSISGCRHPS